ncbi:MAG: acylphosphatase [Egibacteraceae bacterium]
MADKRVRVVVTGEVQGVFFRDTTRRLAQRLGLSGWVRNRSDGSVEAEFQGPPATLDRAVAFCRSGPRHALVTSIDVEAIDLVPNEPRFVVR